MIDAGATTRSSPVSSCRSDTFAVSLGDESHHRPRSTAVSGVAVITVPQKIRPPPESSCYHIDRAASVARRGGAANSATTGEDISSLGDAARRLNEAIIRSVSSEGTEDEKLFSRVVVEGLAADFRRQVQRRHHAASSESETRSLAQELMEAGGPMPKEEGKTDMAVAGSEVTFGYKIAVTKATGGGGDATAVHNGLDVDVKTMDHPSFVITSPLVENSDHAVANAATIDLAAGSKAAEAPSKPETEPEPERHLCSPVVAATQPLRLQRRGGGFGVGPLRTLAYRCHFPPSPPPLLHSPISGGKLQMAPQRSNGIDLGSTTAAATTEAAATVRRRLRRVIDQAVALYASRFFAENERIDEEFGMYADDIVRLRRGEVTELVERATLALQSIKDDYKQEDPDALLDPVAEAARRLNEAVVLAVRSSNDDRRAQQLVEELAAEYRRLRKAKKKETQAEARPSQPIGRIALSEFDDRLDQLMTLTMTPSFRSSVSVAKQVVSGSQQPLGTTAATAATHMLGRGPGSERNPTEFDNDCDAIKQEGEDEGTGEDEVEDNDVLVRSQSLRIDEWGNPMDESRPHHLHPPAPLAVKVKGRVGKSVKSVGRAPLCRSSSDGAQNGAEAPTLEPNAPFPAMDGDDDTVAPIPFYANASKEEWDFSTSESTQIHLEENETLGTSVVEQGVTVDDVIGGEPWMAGGRIMSEAESYQFKATVHESNATTEEAANKNETIGVGSTAEGLETDGADVVAAVVTAGVVAAALATKAPVVAAGAVVAPLVSSAIQSIKASPAIQAIQRGWRKLEN